MSLTVDCKNLSGKINVPYSKSMAHRYLIASFLSGNYDAIKKFDETNISDDVLATKECLLSLISNSSPFMLNCNESGTTLRIIISIIAALGINAEIKTVGTLASRPMDALVNVLREHGAIIEIHENTEGRTYSVSGKINPGEYSISGEISSQYISSLLFALPLLGGESIIKIEGEIASKPYIDLTLKTLEEFNIEIKPSRNNFVISSNQRYIYPTNATELLEGDWSQGAIWLSANSHLNTIEVLGLDEDSLQPDAFIQDVLEIEDDLDVIVSAKDCPDLVPAISLWALPRSGKTTITELNRLKYKESDRLSSLHEIIESLGGNAEIVDDNLIIVGSNGKLLHPKIQLINTYNDHRMVMFASLASVVTDGSVTIDSPESVAKSYPNFFEEIKRLGGILRWN